MKEKITIKNTIKHFNLITRHKWEVFKLCCRIGIPWRGLLHDLSKYSPTEFWESVKYLMEKRVLLLYVKKKTDIQKHGYIIKAETNTIMNIG